ncbi:MAG: trimethylamine methyltransferase family protein [Gammaproteobacteria bacterium]|nr:trimethylamine methyltransferase family protein [Gammaproteobacteria bacterium]MDH3411765.1 trimethylamine methyltransferase family protein [Gammaproteobacteria bacterium]
MPTGNRGRGRRGGHSERMHRERVKSADLSRSLPITVRLKKLDLLDPIQIERIHAASLEILNRTGVVFRSDEAVKYFRQAGARIEGARVSIEEALVSHALESAPSSYTLTARSQQNSVTIGGDHCAVMPGGGPPFVRGLDGVRRTGTLADVERITKISCLSPEIHVIGRKPVEAQDLPVETRHLQCWHTILALADKPVQSGFVNGKEEAMDALEMLAIVLGGEETLRSAPAAHCSVNVNSPLVYDTAMVESLMAFARYGQVNLISPFVMAGVSGPTTMAGALAQQNAEVLAGIVLTQLVNPGAPVLYGTASSNLDMRTGAPAIASPESAICIGACAQLARRYNLPCRGGGALTDSPVPDAQSNYERMFTLLTSVLCGVNYLMHGAGIIESYLTLSYEQLMLDLDQIAMVRRLVAGIEVSDEALALNAIHEVGPGGFFLDSGHTLQHFRDAFFSPRIGVRQSFEQWEAAGAKDALARARDRWSAMLDAYVEPVLESSRRGELDTFVERRSRELL